MQMLPKSKHRLAILIEEYPPPCLFVWWFSGLKYLSNIWIVQTTKSFADKHQSLDDHDNTHYHYKWKLTFRLRTSLLAIVLKLKGEGITHTGPDF